MQDESLNINLFPLEMDLPQIVSNAPIVHRIKDSTNSVYDVDITAYTCTCPNWQEDRQRFSTSDARRVCKHISSLVNFIPFSWVMPLPSCDYKAATFEIGDYAYAIIRKEDDNWVDIKVLNPKNETYNYGYNVEEKRWSSRSRPRHAKLVKPLIASWVGKDLKRPDADEMRRMDLLAEIEKSEVEGLDILEIEWLE